MAVAEELQVVVDAQTRNATRQLNTLSNRIDNASERIEQFGRGMKDAGKTMTGFVTAPIVAAGGAAVKFASDVQESLNAVNVVFGESAGIIEDYGETAAENAGLSQASFNQAATTIGAALKNAGLSMDEAANESINLTQRAADLASVFNTDVNQALGALQAGLRGEIDPLERFGVSMNAAAIEAKALEEGIISAGEEMTAQQKVQARLLTIMEQTSDVAGDFANTSEDTANSLRILRARAENVAAEFGENLLPIADDMIDVASDLVDGFSNLTTEQQNWLTVLGGTAAAAGPALFIAGQMVTSFQTVRTAIIGARIAFAALNATMKASVIGITVTAVAALAGGIATLVQNMNESNDSIARQRRESNRLLDEMEGLNEGSERRKELIDDLNDRYPDLNDNIDTETASTKELREEVNRLNQERQQEVESRILGNLSDIIAAQSSARESVNNLREAVVNARRDFGENSQAYETAVSSLNEAEAAHESLTMRANEQRTALEELRNALILANAEIDNSADSADDAAGSSEDAASAGQVYTDVRERLNEQLQRAAFLEQQLGDLYDEDAEKAEALETAINTLAESEYNFTTRIQQLKDEYPELISLIQDETEATRTAADVADEHARAWARANPVLDALARSSFDVARGITQIGEASDDSGDEISDSWSDAIEKMRGAQIVMDGIVDTLNADNAGSFLDGISTALDGLAQATRGTVVGAVAQIGSMVASAISGAINFFGGGQAAEEFQETLVRVQADAQRQMLQNTKTRIDQEHQAELSAINNIRNAQLDSIESRLDEELQRELEQIGILRQTREEYWEEQERRAIEQIANIEDEEISRLQTMLDQSEISREQYYDRIAEMSNDLTQQEIDNIQAAVTAQQNADQEKRDAERDYQQQVAQWKREQAQFEKEQAIAQAEINMEIAISELSWWERNVLNRDSDIRSQYDDLIGSIENQPLPPAPSFAHGGQFITDGPQMIQVGDNPSGQERVTVEPLSDGDNDGGVNQEIIIELDGRTLTRWFNDTAEKGTIRVPARAVG